MASPQQSEDDRESVKTILTDEPHEEKENDFYERLNPSFPALPTSMTPACHKDLMDMLHNSQTPSSSMLATDNVGPNAPSSSHGAFWSSNQMFCQNQEADLATEAQPRFVEEE